MSIVHCFLMTTAAIQVGLNRKNQKNKAEFIYSALFLYSRKFTVISLLDLAGHIDSHVTSQIRVFILTLEVFFAGIDMSFVSFFFIFCIILCICHGSTSISFVCLFMLNIMYVRMRRRQRGRNRGFMIG